MVKRWQIIFCVIFFIIIYVPLIVLPLTAGEKIEYRESRWLATMPEIKLFFTHPKAFQTYLNNFIGDHLFFRTVAIKIHNYLYIAFYHASPDDDVVIGKNDWLYCASNNAFADYAGKSRYSPADLKKIKNNLKEKKGWAEKNNMKFLVVVTPNKETIYPESLPASIVRSAKATKLDQILTYLQQNEPQISIVDLRNTLLSHKKQRLLFQKTDSHWNYYGAYYGYRAVIEDLRIIYPEMTPYPLNYFHFEQKQNSGDLAIMLFMEDIYSEKVPTINSKKSLTERQIKYQAKNNFHIATYNNLNKNLPKLVFLRDSFGSYFIPFLSNHFRETLYILSHSDNNTDLFEKQKPIILREEPDLLIYQITERALDVFLNK